MKLQATVTTAFPPAALAAASISLAFLLLPGAAAPAHSSGLAPALEAVAGNVVAAVETPVHTVARPARRHRNSVVSRPARPATTPVGTRSQATSVAKRTSSAPHRHTAHRHVPQTRPVTRTHVTTHSAPPAAPVSPANHGRGKAKALGHVKNAAPKPTVQPSQNVRSAGGHGKALGRPADVPPGPPAVPPGQAKKAVAGSDGRAAAHGRGGAR